MGKIPKKTILVVDDEPQIRKFLRISLGAHDHTVIEAATGAEAVALATQKAPDLIILDLSLPDLDGHEALSRLRDCCRAAIIVLTVRTGEADKIEALDRGADDYVTKPFGIGELMTRIEIALRHRAAAGAAPRREFRTADLVVDLESHRVTRGTVDIPLTPREFETLRLLVRHAGKVLTHQQILREVWGPAHIHETQYLRVHIGTLRKKLEPEPARPRFIITEPAVGYRFKPADEG
jgi:two-component system KDP operon response regulator KdpE